MTIKNLFTVLFITLAVSTTYAKEIVVSRTADSGEGTLRQAILDANANYGPDKIIFNIPMSDKGFLPSEITGQPGDAFFIRLVSPLPKITEVLIIDGKSQTRFTGNTNPTLPEFSGAEIFIAVENSIEPLADGHIDGVALESYPEMDDQVIAANNDTFILAATLMIQDVEIVVRDQNKDQRLMKAVGGKMAQR